MTKPDLIRVASGLAAALLVAVILKFGLFDVHDPARGSFFGALQSAVAFALIYVLPLSLLMVAALEFLKLRQIAFYLGGGLAIAFAAAYLSTFNQLLTSQAFENGALSAVFAATIGTLAALAYWGIAGRHAGWRGDAAERSHALALEAFKTASANIEVTRCWSCLVGRAAIGLVLFMLLCWASVDLTGLRSSLMAEAEYRGKVVLRTAGYAWATFRVNGDLGVVEGAAPDEVAKRAAYDSIRETLASVTGFPGIVSRIENRASFDSRTSDASRRENEAQSAIEAARMAAEAARAAEAETRRRAEEQVSSLEAEARRKIEEHALNTEAEIKRRLEEQARLAEDEIKRRLEEQKFAAQEEARQKVAAQAAASAAAAQTAQVAAVEPEVEPPVGAAAERRDVTGNEAAEPATEGGSCTTQDLAIIESSRVHFEAQRFDIVPGYEGEIDRLAASAKACAPRAILVSGYADTDADSIFNPSLALQRAELVRSGLIGRGVPANLVVAELTRVGSAGDTPGRAANRRTEFKVIAAADVSRDSKLAPDERAKTCESDLTEIMSQSIIHFSTASARIGEDSYPLIKRLANAIKTCGSVIVTVEGHTDRLGSEAYNQGLSEARANSVLQALASYGADPTRLAGRGFAASRPYDAGDTSEAFALNRRIEFRVSGKFTSTNAGGP